MLPKVSLIVSSFNRPRLIRDALDSAFDQGGIDLNLVVADDWSDEEVYRVLTDYELDADRREIDFHVVRPGTEPPTMAERQYGQRCAVAINAALRVATGEFVAFVCDDDWLSGPDSLACRARFLVEHPEANVVYGRVEACTLLGGAVRQGRHAMMLGAARIRFGDGGDESYTCEHNREGFWSAEPVVRIANKADHNMVMVRRVEKLPEWPMSVTTEMLELGRAVGEHHANPPQLRIYPDLTCGHNQFEKGESFDCPDAGWFYRLELAGLGPFYSVPDVVVVKRYTRNGHRTDPAVRE